MQELNRNLLTWIALFFAAMALLETILRILDVKT